MEAVFHAEKLTLNSIPGEGGALQGLSAAWYVHLETAALGCPIETKIDRF
jgi:hypothetical protein